MTVILYALTCCAVLIAVFVWLPAQYLIALVGLVMVAANARDLSRRNTRIQASACIFAGLCLVILGVTA